MPPPDILRGYDEIIPGGAERLFKQFEVEAETRRFLTRRGQTQQFLVAISGRLSALIFALGALGVASYALYLGNTTAASIIGGGSIGLVVTGFIGAPLLRERMKRNEEAEKRVSRD